MKEGVGGRERWGGGGAPPARDAVGLLSLLGRPPGKAGGPGGAGRGRDDMPGGECSSVD